MDTKKIYDINMKISRKTYEKCIEKKKYLRMDFLYDTLSNNILSNNGKLLYSLNKRTKNKRINKIK